MAFAQGRGSAILLGLLLAVLQCWAASATTWTVGDDSGWTVGHDYTSWAQGKTFAVGDILFFQYTAGSHNVLVVSEADYTSCSASNAINSYTTGNTNVTLTSTGNAYYICGITGHCGAGQKLAIEVVAASNASSPGTPPSATTPPPPPNSAQSLQIGAVAAFGLGCALLAL